MAPVSGSLYSTLAHVRPPSVEWNTPRSLLGPYACPSAATSTRPPRCGPMSRQRSAPYALGGMVWARAGAAGATASEPSSRADRIWFMLVKMLPAGTLRQADSLLNHELETVVRS